ncbi:GTP pyrophosphokinase YwaC [Pandoraea sputorum]|uniref:GTP pyrophosphokinase YwaC n=2 Tax=Pandoraea sputorum TaxID=93222 RepID=A0A5E5BIX6_9BURK|nr:GTP pyrophosphokinase YwaC [Pandoraea sputorum]
MPAFSPPQYSPKRVKAAGKAVACGQANQDDWSVFGNWRNSHAYVLNTFQNNLRRYIGDRDITFAQRLKRKSTIVNKLQTGRALDLSTMHDLAGCRLIFDSIRELTEFRFRVHGSRSQHKYASENRYDYLNAPKPTGYRGMHDVFRYSVDSKEGKLYNGLRVEIQYRTKVQHAWATAVEISDLIDRARVKFDQGVDTKRERLFVLVSEFLARRYEDSKSAAPDLTDVELEIQLAELEDELRVLHRLAVLDIEKTEIPRSTNIVLHFGNDHLKAEGYRSTGVALAQRDILEVLHPEDDVVYVKASKPGEIATAFRNYFKDTREFVGLLRGGGLNV